MVGFSAGTMLTAAGRSLGLLPHSGGNRSAWGGLGTCGVGPVAGSGYLLDGRTSAVAVQHRGFIEVPVLHNNVEGALRLLGRKQKEEKILKRQTDGLYHIGPAERRKLNKKDSERRLQRKTYKRMLGFVMRRKMRGF